MRLPRRPAKGFTLVEVLIALTLMAMLMVLLLAAMRNMGQTQSAIQEQIDRIDDYQAAVNLLRDVLGEVSARPLDRSAQQPNAPRVMFQGGAQELRWIGMMPARYGMGGRQHMRLHLDKGALVLDFQPWQGEAVLKDWREARQLVLAEPVAAMALRYQQSREGEWQAQWPVEGSEVPQAWALPSAVQIDLEAPWPWPSLVVPVRGALASDPATSRQRFGGE